MTDRLPVPKITDPSPRVERWFRDADGTDWHVTEEPFTDYDRRRGSSLIFSSETTVRRVRNFPALWSTLTDAELLALSWKT